MPINEDTWNHGEPKVSTLTKVREFLSSNPDIAYLATEIGKEVDPQDNEVGEILTGVPCVITLQVLTERGEVKKRSVNNETYYRIADD